MENEAEMWDSAEIAQEYMHKDILREWVLESDYAEAKSQAANAVAEAYVLRIQLETAKSYADAEAFRLSEQVRTLKAKLEASNGRAEVAENNFKQAAALLQSYQDDADQPKNNLIENVKGAIVEAREWIDHKNTCPCWNSNLGWKWCDCGFERLNDFLGEAIDKLHAAPAPACTCGPDECVGTDAPRPDCAKGEL